MRVGKQVISFENKAVGLVGASRAPIGVWDWDLANNMIYADDAVAKVFGLNAALARKGLPPEAYFANIHHEDRPMIIEHSRLSIATHGSCSDNFRIVTPSETKWVHSQGRCFADVDNNTRCFVGLVSEISPQEDFDQADSSIFPGGTASDDVLYLCMHAKRIAVRTKRPFLTYLLEMVIAEVTESQVMNKC